jgi:hypothetical protein
MRPQGPWLLRTHCRSILGWLILGWLILGWLILGRLMLGRLMLGWLILGWLSLCRQRGRPSSSAAAKNCPTRCTSTT